jgi:hypothetical protein
MSTPHRLLLVYHADSGGWRAMWDSAHKLFSPASYACSLCAFTHGLWGEAAAWTAFRTRHPGVISVMHRDEFQRTFPDCVLLTPCVFQIADDGTLSDVLDATAITACVDVDGLIEALERRLSVPA